jgi:hypothetical protein
MAESASTRLLTEAQLSIAAHIYICVLLHRAEHPVLEHAPHNQFNRASSANAASG